MYRHQNQRQNREPDFCLPQQNGAGRKPLTVLAAALDGATARPATKAQVPSSAYPSSYVQGPRPVHSASQTVLKATQLHPHGHTGLSCLRDHGNSRGHPSSHSCLSLIHPPHWPGSDHFHWRTNCKHLNRAGQPRQPKPSPLPNLASVLQQCPPLSSFPRGTHSTGLYSSVPAVPDSWNPIRTLCAAVAPPPGRPPSTPPGEEPGPACLPTTLTSPCHPCSSVAGSPRGSAWPRQGLSEGRGDQGALCQGAPPPPTLRRPGHVGMGCQGPRTQRQDPPKANSRAQTRKMSPKPLDAEISHACD